MAVFKGLLKAQQSVSKQFSYGKVWLLKQVCY
jgi:hypothetical protein